MANFSKVNVSGNEKRTELHDKLSLTGAEVSINTRWIYNLSATALRQPN